MKTLFLCLFFLGMKWGVLAKAETATQTAQSKPPRTDAIIWSHVSLKTIGGKEFKVDQLTNKVVLVVNTASKCGFTPQFKDLETLYQKYREKGLIVLGFPSDDFNQEPGSDQEIAKFCEVNYGVKFPIMAKGSVKGDRAQALFRQLVQYASDKSPVQWNFEKFLIARNGSVVARYRSAEGIDKIEPMLLNQL